MNNEQHAAFLAVAAAHREPLRRAAVRLCGNWHDGDDLAQKTLVKLYLAWPLREPGAVSGWLTRTLVRNYLDLVRRPFWRRERSVDSLPDVGHNQMADMSLDSQLAEALSRLPARQRACLVLRFLQDFSVEQTAETLGCSPGTVRGYTSRGLATVRKSLKIDTEQPYFIGDSA